MMTVSGIFIYPVKSMAGIALAETEVTSRGFKLDRRWLLVDEHDVYITQRTMPSLVYFQPELCVEGLEISYKPSGNKIFVPFSMDYAEIRRVRVWNDSFEAIEVSEKVSEWFTKILNRKVRLMWQPDFADRPVDFRYATSLGQQVSAADGYPVLIISNASLEALNRRLLEPVHILRFRTNLLIDNCLPHIEDELKSIRIGTTVLIGVKPCGRCIMINNDLKTAQIGKEPLKTLSSYRKENGKILFGRNFLVDKPGVISISDKLEIL